MRSPFAYEEPIRVQVTPTYVPRRSVPGSVPVRRVYQSPIYQQAPPKRYPPNPYLSSPQPVIYKTFPEAPRSQARPRQPVYAQERDEEYWRQEESEKSEDSNSKPLIPLQIEAPPSPVKYSPVKHSPRPTASSSRVTQSKKKSTLAPKKDKIIDDEEEDVQPFRKRLGMTNRPKAAKAAPVTKPVPTLTAEVLDREAVYPPPKDSPELTVEEVIEEEAVIDPPVVIISAKQVAEQKLASSESLIFPSESPVERKPILKSKEKEHTSAPIVEKVVEQQYEKIETVAKMTSSPLPKPPVKIKSKSKKVIISSSDDDVDAPVAEPSAAKPVPSKDSESLIGRYEEPLKSRDEVIPATQFDSQSTNDYLNQDFNDDFGSPSGFPQYEPKAQVDSDDNVSPVKSDGRSERSIQGSPIKPKPKPKKRAHNENGKTDFLWVVKKDTKPKSVKVKKEPEFKRPHPGPVVVHVERPVIDDSSTERRSKRAKVAPVAFWRNEKVIYGRRESGMLQDLLKELRCKM
jgi:hypothetical protein